jgi:MerR family copper efflux transcriptional regulator
MRPVSCAAFPVPAPDRRRGWRSVSGGVDADFSIKQNDLLPPPRRTAAGQREYGLRDVARVRVIRELLSMGLTVADVRDCRDRLDLMVEDTLPPYGGPGACAHPLGIAQRRLDALDAEIAR